MCSREPRLKDLNWMLGLSQAKQGTHIRDVAVPGWSICVMQPVEIAHMGHSVRELLSGILVPFRS